MQFINLTLRPRAHFCTDYVPQHGLDFGHPFELIRLETSLCLAAAEWRFSNKHGYTSPRWTYTKPSKLQAMNHRRGIVKRCKCKIPTASQPYPWGSGLFISTGRAWGVLYRMSLPLLYMNVFYGTQYDPTLLLFRKIFPAAPLYYLKHFIYFICYITTIPFYMFDKYSYTTDTTFEYYRTTA
jgi:hypothetical protein